MSLQSVASACGDVNYLNSPLFPLAAYSATHADRHADRHASLGERSESTNLASMPQNSRLLTWHETRRREEDPMVGS